MSQKRTVTIDFSKLKSTRAIVLMIILVLVMGGVSYFTDVQISLDLRIQMLVEEHWVEFNSTWSAHQQPVSYLVTNVTSGGTTYFCMQNGSTGKLDWYDTNGIDVLQACVNNITDAGIIFIKSPWDTGMTQDTLVVTKALSIVSDVKERASYSSRRVCIDRIVVNASANTINAFQMKGVFTRSLHFYFANDYSILGTVIEDCAIVSANTAGSDGLTFEGDQSSADIWDAVFRQCYIYNQKTNKEAGAINFKSCGMGTSQLYWQECCFNIWSGNSSFIVLDWDARIGLEIRFDCDNTLYAGSHDDTNFLRMKGTPTSPGYTTGLRIYFTDMDWDQHSNMTMFQIDSSVEDKGFGVRLNDCLISTSAGGNTTFINNQNTNWKADTVHGVQFEGNVVLAPELFEWGNFGTGLTCNIERNLGINATDFKTVVRNAQTINIGLNDAYGTVYELKPSMFGHYLLFIPHMLRFSIGGTFAGETLTYRLTFLFEDGTSYSITWTKTTTGSATPSLYDFRNVPTGRTIMQLDFDAKVDSASTALTLSFIIYIYEG